VWRQDDVLAFCRSQDADALFRLARRYGHSNESIAYWTGIDPAEVSKRITGGKGPVRTLDRWLRIAEALDMPDEARQILGLASRRRDSATSAAPLVADDLSTSHHPVLFGVRQGGAPPSAVDPCLPRTLLDLLVHYAQTDNMLGPRSLLLAVTSQLTLIEQLWTVARGPLRSELLGVGARYAEFAGWLHQDAGDHTTGARWTLQALDLAHAAGSPILASYALMRRSNQASSVGDGTRALGLASAALDVPEARHPMLRALALRQRARGHALEGSVQDCQRALDEARQQAALGSTDSDEAVRDLAGYCTVSYVEMEAADCWTLLGRPERAVPIFEAELAAWPEIYRRDRGVHLARLATAYVACGILDEAERIGLEALAVAEQTGSSRAVDELGRSLHRSGTELAPLRERLAMLTRDGKVG
jgi:tetratricopeptide (TPR) repeat protein